jgi:hypothetical protein
MAAVHQWLAQDAGLAHLPHEARRSPDTDDEP